MRYACLHTHMTNFEFDGVYDKLWVWWCAREGRGAWQGLEPHISIIADIRSLLREVWISISCRISMCISGNFEIVTFILVSYDFHSYFVVPLRRKLFFNGPTGVFFLSAVIIFVQLFVPICVVAGSIESHTRPHVSTRRWARLWHQRDLRFWLESVWYE